MCLRPTPTRLGSAEFRVTKGDNKLVCLLLASRRRLIPPSNLLPWLSKCPPTLLIPLVVLGPSLNPRVHPSSASLPTPCTVHSPPRVLSISMLSTRYNTQTCRNSEPYTKLLTGYFNSFVPTTQPKQRRIYSNNAHPPFFVLFSWIAPTILQVPKPKSTPCILTAYPVISLTTLQPFPPRSSWMLHHPLLDQHQQQTLKICLQIPNPPPAFHRNLSWKFCFFFLSLPSLGVLHPTHHFHPFLRIL